MTIPSALVARNNCYPRTLLEEFESDIANIILFDSSEGSSVSHVYLYANLEDVTAKEIISTIDHLAIKLKDLGYEVEHNYSAKNEGTTYEILFIIKW